MVTFDNIEAAHRLIGDRIHRTPLLTSRYLDDRCGARLIFKCENFQKVGAFKIRGATNAVFGLTDGQAARGVATHSSGNHGAALAQAAAWRGIPATVVCPENAPEVKKRAMEHYGANLIYCTPTLQARETTLQQYIDQHGATFIHPYNNPQVIAGQGTAAKELIEDGPTPDLVLVPVGGGGLTSGTALTVKHLLPNAQVIAVEPAGADDAARSFRAGHLIPSVKPQTIADGLLTSLGDLTFEIIQKHVDDIVTVSEEAIIEAMRIVWQRMKIIIEPSSAVPVAALLTGQIDAKGKTVGVILSGGNVDLDNCPAIGRQCG